MARQVAHYVRMPVYGASYLISDSEGNLVNGDIFPVHEALNSVRKDRGNAPYEPTFRATINRQSATTYSVQKNDYDFSAKLAQKRYLKIPSLTSNSKV